MIDTRANPYYNVALSSDQDQVISSFSVTQQLGRKPVLHCVCGASLDLNINPKRVLHAFRLAHEGCLDGQV